MFEPIWGATAIDADEAHALIPKHIQTQKELNDFESLNISFALPWANRQKQILAVKFLKSLHKHMFDQTWGWAGQFRRTQKNIGVEAYRIEIELHQMCGDTAFQIENKSFEIDEIATRFHHRLVWIHPFINGNGRHARLATDMLLKTHKHSHFTWGSRAYRSNDLSNLNDMRRSYIEALREADKGYYEPLIAFVRS